jgi:hypothetical protein
MIRSKLFENDMKRRLAAPLLRCLFISRPAIKAFFNWVELGCATTDSCLGGTLLILLEVDVDPGEVEVEVEVEVDSLRSLLGERFKR